MENADSDAVATTVVPTDIERDPTLRIPGHEQTSHGRSEVAEAENGADAETEADDEDDNDSEDRVSFSSSLMDDLLALAGDDNVDVNDPNTLSPEEAKKLKQRLRDIDPNEFIFETLTSGKYSARQLLSAFGVRPPEVLGDDDANYYRLLGLAIIKELESRKKLSDYNTIEDAVELIRKSSKIMVITGAGISTNLGVPDFRSKDTGFYDQMREKMQEKGMLSPEDIFDIEVFREDPTIFYENSGKTLPELGKFTPTHAFVKLLEDKGKLLTNYTQNIDNVEGNVGISKDKLVQCHGSWATFTCIKCDFKTDGVQFYESVKAQKVVSCPRCIESMKQEEQSLKPQSRKRKRGRDSGLQSRSRSRHDDGDDDSEDDGRYDIPQPGVMKPDITFFGEKLPDNFFERFKNQDRHITDLVIVIGTSMTVAPVSEIPMALDNEIPQIYISRDPVGHIAFDINLLGDCDLVTEELVCRLGWELEHPMLKHRRVQVDEMNADKAIWRISEASGDDDGDKSPKG